MNNEDKRKKYYDAMPQVVKDAPQDIQYKWIRWFKFSEEAKNHPLRFYIMEYQDESKVVDLRGFWDKCRKQIKRYGGTQEMLDEAHENWMVISKLKGEKVKLNNTWSGPLRKYSKGSIKTALDTRKADLLDLFGKYHTFEEVELIIKRDWQIFINKKEIKSFYNEHRDLIDAKRANYVLRRMDFKLATDTGRMEDLSMLRMHWIHKFEGNPTMDVSREIRAIDEQARKEIKGNELKITTQGGIDIGMSMQAQKTIDDICKNLPLNLMIIGMVAAKRGVNPMQIQASLASSVYAKFNGFAGFKPDDTVPSMQEHVKLYDWEHIKASNTGKFEEAQLTEWEEVEEEHVTRIEERKTDMMTMLEQMKKKRDKEEKQ